MRFDDRQQAGRALAKRLLALPLPAPRVVLALPRGGVPVAPPDTWAALRREADEAVCLATPQSFHAVGEHCVDFDAVSDRKVIEALDAATREVHDGVAHTRRGAC